MFRHILFLAQLLRYLFDRRLADDGLSTAQAMALSVADRADRPGPPSLGELADELASSHQNVAMLMRALSRRGFVSVAPDPQDGRIRRVIVQPESRQYWESRDADDFAFVAGLFSGISDVELRELADVLSRLREPLVESYRAARSEAG